MVETSSPPFTEHTEQLRRDIDTALEACVRQPDGCPSHLAQAIAYSLLARGKRLRPLLVLMAAEACGGTAKAAMPAACAVEMVHAYSLVHDDLPAMDDDDLRRGRPTCHKAFGEATAILAGDALLTMAFETMATGVHPPQVAAQCCAALARAAGPANMVGGQADDIAAQEGPSRGGRQTLAALESIHNRKTGAMIRVSLELGALVAGADRVQQDALDRYGRRLGLAFQITDDLLDVCSHEATAGKRVGKDAERGKLTFPGLMGVDPSTRRVEQLIQEACEALNPLATPTDHLETLARYVLERNR
ncbi:MAG: polyprenyl synthetase family protein [Pirellulales bacterium]|nr:polyprenyl synthetase family protein [Pirellulales bacterium]